MLESSSVVAPLAVAPIIVDWQPSCSNHVSDGNQFCRIGFTAGDGAGLCCYSVNRYCTVTIDPPRQVAQPSREGRHGITRYLLRLVDLEPILKNVDELPIGRIAWN